MGSMDKANNNVRILAWVANIPSVLKCIYTLATLHVVCSVAYYLQLCNDIYVLCISYITNNVKLIV